MGWQTAAMATGQRSYWAVLSLGLLSPWVLRGLSKGDPGAAHARRAAVLLAGGWALFLTHAGMHLVIGAIARWQRLLADEGVPMPGWMELTTAWLSRFNAGVLAFELLAVLLLALDGMARAGRGQPPRALKANSLGVSIGR